MTDHGTAKTIAFIQARMGSSRLPGKVLADIAGRPSLEQMLRRVQLSKRLDGIVVTTTVNAIDDPVAALTERLGVGLFRGDEQDVLGRMHDAALAFGATVVVRLTADCPMHDATVIDAALEMFADGRYDYVSNAVQRTYPDGLDVEVMSFEALHRAHLEAVDRLHREHVTTYIRGVPAHLPNGDFRIGHLVNDQDFAALRWTVDTLADLDRVRRYYAALPDLFSWRQALALADRLEQLPQP